MPLPIDWATDPVVLLEKRTVPVLGAAPGWLLAWHNRGDEPPPDVPLAIFRDAESVLFSAGDDILQPVGIQLSEPDRDTCRAAGQVVRDLRLLLERLAKCEADAESLARTAQQQIDNRLGGAIEAALDVFRRNFIGTVLIRQKRHAEATEAAMRHLTLISRKIFFVSVNASVEAARLGEGGKGMQVISKEVRALSRDAECATTALLEQLQGSENGPVQ